MLKLATAFLASALAVLAVAPAHAFSGTMGGTGAIENVRDVKQALDKFERGDADGAIGILTGVLATNGLSDESSAVVLYDRGKIYLSKGERKNAIDDFSAAIEKRPRYQPPYIMLAQAYFDAGEPAKGIAELKAALDVDPNSAMAHLNLANAYHHQNDDTHALVEYDEAIGSRVRLLRTKAAAPSIC
jgi:predicted Zn-dependent protease